MSFIKAKEAIDGHKIPKGITGFSNGDVYHGDDVTTGACGEVENLNDGNQSILIISKNIEGFQIKCGHIMNGGTCGYLSHVNGEDTQCPLAEAHAIISQGEDKKQAA